MMPDNSIEIKSDDIDKAAKWTVFLLVDLRLLFIITYVYVSVVNLISTTANSEASEDIHSTRLFNVTSQLEHANVNVSFIDDAILWNCRDHSDTKHYYRGLYWMLISAFSATMVAFVLTKITIIFGTKHGLLYLWRLAVTECLQERLKSDEKQEEANNTTSTKVNDQNEGKQQSHHEDHKTSVPVASNDNCPLLEGSQLLKSDEINGESKGSKDFEAKNQTNSDECIDDKDESNQSEERQHSAVGDEKRRSGKPPSHDCSKMDEVIKKAKKLLSEENPLSKVESSADEDCFKRYNFCRVFNLCLSVLILLIGIVLTFLFYDLHPLSCIHDQREKYIDYDVTEESVRIRFSTEILLTQKGVSIILPVLALLFVTNAFIFYYCNIHIIKIFTKYVREEIKINKDEADGSEKEFCHWCSCFCPRCCCGHIYRLGHCLCFFISE